MRFLRIASLALVMAVSPLAAQMHDHSDHVHDRLGSVNFPNSCSKAVQSEFSRGVAALHSFWFDEAERTFRKVAAADPRCGMAWWGIAMANYHPIWAPPNPAEMERGREAAVKAKKLGAKTARERGYIDAISTFYKDADKVEHGKRASAYEAAMAELSNRFPEDDEAAIFYGISLVAHGMSLPNDKTYTWQKKAAEILNQRLAKNPQHPGVAHYIIHSFDYPALAHLAVDAAHAYSKIAPDSAHALHMPSHIFVRLGLWDDTIASNIASARSGKNYIQQVKPGATSWDALHAYDYLTYAYLQQGEDEKAKLLVDEIPSVSSLDADSFGGYYALAAIPVRYALERRQWAEAASLPVPVKLPSWNRYAYAEAVVHFGRAVGAARIKNVEQARQSVARLQEIRQQLLDQKNNYWAGQVDVQRQAAEAWIARAENRNDEALAMMRSSADLEDSTDKHPVTPGSVLPAREMLAELLLELDQPQKALAEFEESLKTAPNRLNGLTGAARAAQLAGDRNKARAYYVQVAKLLGDRGSVRTAQNE